MTALEVDTASAPPVAERTASRGLRLATVLGLHNSGRVLRDFATYLPTQAIPALAGFLVLPVLARKLAPVDLGVLAIAQTLISLGWTVSGAWLAGAIIRELPAHRARGDLGTFDRTLVRGLGLVALGILGFAGLLGLAAIGSSAIGRTLLLVIAAIAAMAVQNVAVSLFAASLRPRAYAAVEVSARVAGMGVGTALVFGGYGVSGYLASLAGASALIGCVGLALAWPRAGEARQAARPDLGPWLRYGLPASAGSVVIWTLTFVDRYLLAAFKDASAVGVYTMGNALGDRAVMVPMFAFATAAVPLLVTAFETRGRAEVERLMTAYTRILLLVGLPCTAYVAVAGPDLVTLITGYHYNVYAPAATVAPIVAAGSLLFALAGMANTGLAVAKQTKYLVLSGGIGLAANVIANVILIPPLGVKGAAIATPIGMGAYLLATYRWAGRYATWRIPVGTLIRASVASGCAYAAAAVTPLGGSRLGHVAGYAAVGGAAYVLALAVLGERRRA